MIAACVNALDKVGAGGEAESTLSKALKQEWNDELVALYGRLRVERRRSAACTPPRVGSKRAPTTPRCCSRWVALRLANRDWAKAREYFEASLKQRRSAEVYGELGRLCLAMGERPRAAELLAQSLDMSGELPALPLPKQRRRYRGA